MENIEASLVCFSNVSGQFKNYIEVNSPNKWKIINDKGYKYLSKSHKKTCCMILRIKMTSSFSHSQILRFILFNCRHDSNNKYLKSQYRNHFQAELFSLCGNSEKLKRWVYYIRIDRAGCWVTSIKCLRNKPAHFSCNLIFYYGHYHPDVFWPATETKISICLASLTWVLPTGMRVSYILFRYYYFNRDVRYK